MADQNYRIYNFVTLLYIQKNLSTTVLHSSIFPRFPSPDLRQEIPGRVPDVVVGKRGHGEVTVIVPILPPHIHFAFALGRSDEILGQQLVLFVKVVACALL